jgi:hypothetical protein
LEHPFKNNSPNIKCLPLSDSWKMENV